MSAQKIYLASLLLFICLVFPQSTAIVCNFEGHCVTSDDCINVCKSGEDPFLCVRSGPHKGMCCCLKTNGSVLE
ncbi:putative defensin-like protein 277 [Arabidopsis thaliana]|uniref:Putative defensin-like protein 277 n=4 Tax=Arabidopsis TaxID=3701 RepID=DF277_ARATH|nr:Defensin-like (DEFL) family protein [Arabidopsis thaliana]Q2V329.1 RecName: Full=Putative defensin-like protein 277; Flags: Precursor [Arabidopsis thaliana]KAG7604092.1 hypothetical protein ISN45_At05g031800 [Arabidopsis thaliana x Arabidopsis arenosa]KAG7611004.1 hypothetical protein ISN44_As05g031240 [Arabidopsis suecica]AED94193.1 Defensin-like (DEFL) family protein [Arabidopsis thaliana]CAA0405916.1 unnamed protein product [Arabidopsis thaliana]VYS68499.1 unnamed protein product [Arabi|eukprot:NP_001031976.1 Defensin-like (DEFL) family protein [Arabidopsis thaliana]